MQSELEAAAQEGIVGCDEALWKTDVDEAKVPIATLVSQGKQARIEKARAKAHKNFGG